MTLDYQAFIERKTRAHTPSGLEATPHSVLFPFQRYASSWALRTGKACLFAGTGMGKTLMQCDFMRHIDGVRLIVAPLGVAMQTVEEAKALGMTVKLARSPSDFDGDGVYITNYDSLHVAEDQNLSAVVLDESSIIKSHDGMMRQYIQGRFAATPYKLACTATPAPNDYMELGTHAEFVGAMTRVEMLATFFTHDGGDTSKWRLKKHARSDFWRWVSTWALVFAHPRDIGFEQSGYDLPPLEFRDRIIDIEPEFGQGLFGDAQVSATQVFSTLRNSAPERCAAVAEIVASEPNESWLVWCHTDEEQRLIERLVPGIASVAGSHSVAQKEDGLMGFASGKYKILVTKPRIGGYGMNWQHCSRMVFCGVTYSFEQVYQCVRRCWRFGQTRPVIVYMVTCNAQDSIKTALRSKDEAFKSMADEMCRYTGSGAAS